MLQTAICILLKASPTELLYTAPPCKMEEHEYIFN